MLPPDPYSRDPPFLYGCARCDRRLEAAHRPEQCPECAGPMTAPSVPRE